MADERLDFAERWLLDGLRVLRPAVSVHQIAVDMTNAMRRLDDLRRDGVQATPTHLLIRATARALASMPQVHQLVAGTRRHHPTSVDIGLSVSGDTFVAPVLVIEGADRKSIADIVDEIGRRTPEVREADRRMANLLRRWGWLAPIGVMRRAILRALFSSGAFRRQGAGTFQISTVPVDWALTTTFATGGVLVAGRVWPRVVAVDGRAEVRPMMILTLSADHAIWEGRSAARFLAAIKTELEAA